MKAALLGHGTIGVGVDRIIRNIDGIDIVRVLALETDEEILGRHTFSADDILNDPEIDTVIEVMGGIHPAWEYLSRALEAGKNVVTANKAVVAAYYGPLMELASRHHAAFRCTAAVGGGIPWLVNLERLRRGDTVTKIGGIMNGTTNFILTGMEAGGKSFAEALSDAQALGYAEKDPSADIDGADVRRKLCISANAAFDCLIDENTIPTAGIRFVREADLAFAKSLGRKLKLAAFASKNDGGISAFAVPVLIPGDSVLAAIGSNINCLSLTAENAGELFFAGQGAGRYPTAENVAEDVIDIREGLRTFYTDTAEPVTLNNSAVCPGWYIRTCAPDTVPAEYVCSEAEGALILKETPVDAVFEMIENIRSEDREVFFAAIL